MLTRLSVVFASAALAVLPTAHAAPAAFEVVAHQGGPAGTANGEFLPTFAKALEIGVSTVELDIGITKDRQPVVWHDEFIDPAKCSDTTPAFDADPQYPYTGKFIHDLTVEQIRTMHCGNRIALLSQVFALVADYGADVRFDIETKVDAEQPERTADPQTFVDVILAAVRAAGILDKAEIESFDWRTLELVRRTEPSIPLVALWDAHTWKAGSAWLGGVDPAVVPDPATAASTVGVTILSPDYSLVDRAMVERAHAAAQTLLPWTVDDVDEMRTQIDYGVDGIVTDYPAVLREVLAERGMTLPRTYRRN